MAVVINVMAKTVKKTQEEAKKIEALGYTITYEGWLNLQPYEPDQYRIILKKWD